MAKLAKLRRPMMGTRKPFEESEHPRAAGGRFGDKPDEAMPAKGRFMVIPKAKPTAVVAPAPDGAHSDLRSYLGMVAGMYPPDQPSTAQFLVDTGQDFKFDSASFKGGTPQQCYKNSAQAVLADPNLTYVEGFVSVHGVPIAHAWTVGNDGKVIDQTIGEGGRGIQGYYGTPINREHLLSRMVASRIYGLLSGKPSDVLKTIAADPKKVVAPIRTPAMSGSPAAPSASTAQAAAATQSAEGTRPPEEQVGNRSGR